MTLLQFEQVCASTPYRVKGTFYSEIYRFLQACHDHKVTMVFESGVKNGMSTRLLASQFFGAMVSIERSPIDLDVPGVQLVTGDSTILLSKMVARVSPQERVGVLIDGPKGRAALKLKDACLKAGARVVAVHDQPAGAGESRHSHALYDHASSLLDRFILDRYLQKYPKGPGMAIWESKRQKERQS